MDYYSEEEKFFKFITGFIAKKENKKPSDIELWSLPDISIMYAIYMEESMSIEDMLKT